MTPPKQEQDARKIVFEVEQKVRRYMDTTLRVAGLSMAQYLKLKTDLEESLPEGFTQDLGDYTATIETSHITTYPQSTAKVIGQTKHLKLHRRK